MTLVAGQAGCERCEVRSRYRGETFAGGSVKCLLNIANDSVRDRIRRNVHRILGLEDGAEDIENFGQLLPLLANGFRDSGGWSG